MTETPSPRHCTCRPCEHGKRPGVWCGKHAEQHTHTQDCPRGKDDARRAARRAAKEQHEARMLEPAFNAEVEHMIALGRAFLASSTDANARAFVVHQTKLVALSCAAVIEARDDAGAQYIAEQYVNTPRPDFEMFTLEQLAPEHRARMEELRDELRRLSEQYETQRTASAAWELITFFVSPGPEMVHAIPEHGLAPFVYATLKLVAPGFFPENPQQN